MLANDSRWLRQVNADRTLIEGLVTARVALGQDADEAYTWVENALFGGQGRVTDTELAVITYPEVRAEGLNVASELRLRRDDLIDEIDRDSVTAHVRDTLGISEESAPHEAELLIDFVVANAVFVNAPDGNGFHLLTPGLEVPGEEGSGYLSDPATGEPYRVTLQDLHARRQQRELDRRGGFGPDS